MKFKEGVDYNYVIPESEQTTVGIKLLTGPFRDVTYQYGKVKFEEAEGGDIYLKFVYNILESPYEKLSDDNSFKNYIGDILVEIMSQNIDKGLLDEAGTDYIEESDSK
jgi:hypothetical protein